MDLGNIINVLISAFALFSAGFLGHAGEHAYATLRSSLPIQKNF